MWREEPQPVTWPRSLAKWHQTGARCLSNCSLSHWRAQRAWVVFGHSETMSSEQLDAEVISILCLFCWKSVSSKNIQARGDLRTWKSTGLKLKTLDKKEKSVFFSWCICSVIKYLLTALSKTMLTRNCCLLQHVCFHIREFLSFIQQEGLSSDDF